MHKVSLELRVKHGFMTKKWNVKKIHLDRKPLVQTDEMPHLMRLLGTCCLLQEASNKEAAAFSETSVIHRQLKLHSELEQLRNFAFKKKTFLVIEKPAGKQLRYIRPQIWIPLREIPGNQA
jgi:hypothetical protein